MKTGKLTMLWIAMAAILLFDSGINLASAYDVTVRNTTVANVNVFLYVRSSWSWDTFPHSLINTARAIAPGGAYTFSVPVDSQNICPSYLAGYDANFDKGIAMMGCDGVEVDNSTQRCCVNSAFEVYKKSDGSLHFQKK